MNCFVPWPLLSKLAVDGTLMPYITLRDDYHFILADSYEEEALSMINQKQVEFLTHTHTKNQYSKLNG